MGDDIGLGLSSMAVCFDFRSTNVVQLSNRNPYFYQFWCHHPLITTLAQMLQRFILFWKSSTQVIHSFNENSSLKTCVTLYALSRWPQHLLMFALISDVFFGSKTYLLGDNVTRFAFATTPNNQIFFFSKIWWNSEFQRFMNSWTNQNGFSNSDCKKSLFLKFWINNLL